MLRMGIDTHLITANKAIPLMLNGNSEHGLIVEMTDGTSEYNKNYRRSRRVLLRPGQGDGRTDHAGPDRRAEGNLDHGGGGDSWLAAF